MPKCCHLSTAKVGRDMPLIYLPPGSRYKRKPKTSSQVKDSVKNSYTTVILHNYIDNTWSGTADSCNNKKTLWKKDTPTHMQKILPEIKVARGWICYLLPLFVTITNNIYIKFIIKINRFCYQNET